MWQDTIDREPYEESFIGLVVRKDLLDKAGLDIPVTLDDWYEALVAFKIWASNILFPARP